MARSSSFLVLLCALVFCEHVAAFVVPGVVTRHGAAAGSTCMMAEKPQKGFGPKKGKKEKSAGQTAREAAAKQYEKTAGSGAPEYNIFVRPVGTDQFVPAGTMAVPRSVQLADAVFEQEENLRKGLKRTFAKIADVPLEFGYNLKCYPDEEIRLLERREATTDPVVRFFEGLLSPLNTNDMKTPPPPPPAP
ncbi:unnamed protein product [Phaeothamnion confervicola]